MTVDIHHTFPLTSANILAAVRRERMVKRGAHATQNSFHWLCSEYLASSKFASLSLNSQVLWGRELRFASKVLGRALLRAETKKEEDQTIRPKMVLDYLGALSDKPAKAAAALSAVRALSKWAEVSDLLPRDITSGIKIPKSKGGHIPWTDEQVELAVTHARPDLARAVLLASCTGQRCSDLVKMSWSDIRSVQGRQGIGVTQKKTGVQLWIPINNVLAAAMATWVRQPGKILRDAKNQPWAESRLSEAWAWERHHNPKLEPLRHLVIHGLRGHVCVRLIREGCTTKEIGNMVGMSEKMVSNYTRLSSNEENNLATIIRLENFRGTKPLKAENE